MLNDIKENSEYDPGWDERGGLFIARNKVSPIVLNTFYNLRIKTYKLSFFNFLYSFASNRSALMNTNVYQQLAVQWALKIR